jgi:hypothetical protein
MDVQQVNERVANIAAQDDDAEQHAQEDRLHRDVLKAIANGAPNAAELALSALKTSDLIFDRWYA